MSLAKELNMTSNRRLNCRGYVLLSTLLLLMLVATALASACRISLRQALAAQEAERSMQAQWSAISCQRTLLPQCENVLNQEQQRTHKLQLSCRQSLILNGEDIQLIFADEQAKSSTEALLKHLDKADALTALRQLLSGTGLAAHLKLRPIAALITIAHIRDSLAQTGPALTGGVGRRCSSALRKLWTSV